MSVIVRNNPSVGVGGSTSNNFPPGNIGNIQHITKNKTVMIKWTDPEDTIVDNIIFAKWKGTILIRNKDHYPNSIKDGDIVIDNNIRNKYKDIWYEDTNLINNTTYYYRFFTYSEDKVYNDSGAMIFKEKPLNIAPIFKDNTWEQIIAASETNSIPSTWKIGDEIDLTLSGEFNETVTMQIWDFSHYYITNGGGRANILFGMKHLMKYGYVMNDPASSLGGWNECYMRKTVMNNILNSIPEYIRKHIKEINNEANIGDSTLSQTCTDKVFLPGFDECNGSWSNNDGTHNKIPIFTSTDNQIKKMSNGTGVAASWWTRSPDSYGQHNFCRFTENGTGARSKSNYPLGVCFCFNI